MMPRKANALPRRSTLLPKGMNLFPKRSLSKRMAVLPERVTLKKARLNFTNLQKSLGEKDFRI